MQETDIVTAAGLVARQVRSGERDGVATRTLLAARTYPTDRADLWAVLTDPERLPRWFLPVTGDLRVGGRYQTEGNAGGTVLACEEPSALSLTWEFGETVSWLDLRLEEADDGTRLELRHEAPVDPEMWQQYGPGALGLGWDGALLGLGRHLETGEALDPAAAEAMMATPDGAAFLGLAGGSWEAAAVSAGEDPEVMQAAMQRSVAFYTPQD